MDRSDVIGGLRALADGATFSLSDEAEALLRAKLMGQGNYDDILRSVRAQQARFNEAHPYASLGLNLVGGIAGGGAGLMTRAGRQVAKFAARGPAEAGLAGALASGAYGFGAGEGGAGNRLRSAAEEAPYGALFGFAPAAGAAMAKRRKKTGAAAGLLGALGLSAAPAFAEEPEGYARGGYVDRLGGLEQRAAQPPVITIGG